MNIQLSAFSIVMNPISFDRDLCFKIFVQTYVFGKWSLIKVVVTGLLTEIINKNGVKRIVDMTRKNPYKDVGKRRR